MTCVVVVWQLGFGKDAAMEYEDRVWGPYRDEERAHEVKERFERALTREGLDERWSVSVEYVFPGRESARAMVEDIRAMDEQRQAARG